MRMSDSRAALRRAPRSVIVLACGLVASIFAPGAMAQDEPRVERRVAISVGGMGALSSEAISARALRDYSRILGLDEDQRAALRGLLEGHRAARTALDRDTREKFGALNEKMNGDGADRASIAKVMGEEMPKINDEARAKGEELERQFFGDLKGLITEEQLTRFDAVERHRRREVLLQSGHVYGASTDLVAVVRELYGDREPEKGVVGVLDEYEKNLDRLLVERRRLNRESQQKFAEMQKKSAGNEGGGFLEMGNLDEINKPIMEIGTQIRDMNRQTSARIAGVLEGEQRTAFEREVKRREFPRVYRTPHVVKAIDAALGLADLSDSQRSELAALKGQYERDSVGPNDAWARALEERQKDQGGMVIVRIDDGGPAEKDPVGDAKKARKGLDASYEQRLASVLNEEQRKKLPSKTPEKSGARVVMQGGGAGGMPMELDLDDLDIDVGGGGED